MHQTLEDGDYQQKCNGSCYPLKPDNNARKAAKMLMKNPPSESNARNPKSCCRTEPEFPPDELPERLEVFSGFVLESVPGVPPGDVFFPGVCTSIA